MFEDIKPHLAALQKSIGYSVLSVILAFIIAFTFHNHILTWITAPLNSALAEVGRVIESQEKATWHLKATDQNKTIDDNKTAIIESNITKSPSIIAVDKLTTSLEKAITVANQELQGFKNLNPINSVKEEIGSLKDNFAQLTQLETPEPTVTTTTQVEPKQNKEITFKKKTVKQDEGIEK